MWQVGCDAAANCGRIVRVRTAARPENAPATTRERLYGVQLRPSWTRPWPWCLQHWKAVAGSVQAVATHQMQVEYLLGGTCRPLLTGRMARLVRLRRIRRSPTLENVVGTRRVVAVSPRSIAPLLTCEDAARFAERALRPRKGSQVRLPLIGQLGNLRVCVGWF